MKCICKFLIPAYSAFTWYIQAPDIKGTAMKMYSKEIPVNTRSVIALFVNIPGGYVNDPFLLSGKGLLNTYWLIQDSLTKVFKK